MDEPNKTIKIRGVDGKVVELSKKAAEKSEILKGMIEDYPDDTELQIKSIKGDALSKIKEYLEHYEEIPAKEVSKPLKSIDFKDCVDEWDYNFIGKVDDNETLENLILAANFLNIKPL